jgi:hypothetical protein
MAFVTKWDLMVSQSEITLLTLSAVIDFSVSSPVSMRCASSVSAVSIVFCTISANRQTRSTALLTLLSSTELPESSVYRLEGPLSGTVSARPNESSVNLSEFLSIWKTDLE